VYEQTETSMNMTHYLDLKKFQPLLTKTQLKNISLIIQPKDRASFSNFFQNRMCKRDGNRISLAKALEAVENGEKNLRQYPLNTRNLRDKAVSIFCAEQWLIFDPVMGFVKDEDDKMFCVGGRHRIVAIASVFAQLASVDNLLPPQEMFDIYLQQEIRVDILYLRNREQLSQLVVANNDGRNITKAEEAHLKLQARGEDLLTPEGAVQTALNSIDISAKETRELAAQYFTRKDYPGLRPQTRQIIGERIAQWVLYGARRGDKLNQNPPLLVDSMEEFMYIMDYAWNILLELIEGKIVIARDYMKIAEEIIDRLISFDIRNKAKF
jgi:hypothetical protein